MIVYDLSMIHLRMTAILPYPISSYTYYYIRYWVCHRTAPGYSGIYTHAHHYYYYYYHYLYVYVYICICIWVLN